MKKICTLALSALLALSANAMPARRGTFTVTQPNGTTLTLRLVGDEFSHYYVNVANGQRMLQNGDGTFVALDDAYVTRMETAAQQRRVVANKQRLQRMESNGGFYNGALTEGLPAELNSARPNKAVGTFNNNLNGQKKGLVILVNFADLEHSLDDPQLEWDRAFNEVGYTKNNHVGSVHDYFFDQSYGHFDLEFDVMGPVTVSKKMSYYGTNNSYGSDAHAAEMVVEACKLVNNQVNFADYDWDGDGEVDQVYVIYAGYGESSGAPAETIWPHEYWIEYGYGSKLYLDGVYINTYACSCELRGDGRGMPVQNGIGTACHEFSHCIGYPDFYDVEYGGFFGMDEWDVMCNGGYNGPNSACEVPVGYTAYERWMAGWLKPVELTEGCEIKDMPCLLDEPVAYLLRNKNKGTIARPIDEYLLLENRQPQKWFYYPAQAHGMLITHVDYNKSAWSQNIVNTKNNGGIQRMTIVPAGKTFGTYSAAYKSWYASNDEYRSMLFPGRRMVAECTDDTHYDVNLKLHNRNTDGTYSFGFPLTEITEHGGKIDFLLLGGPDDGSRWSVAFDAGNGTTDAKDWKQTRYGETIILPEAVSAIPGWRFMGWSTNELSTPTTQRPYEIYAPGTTFKPTEDTKFYAVYGTTAQGELVDEYKLVNEFTNERQYLLVSKNAASSVDVVAVDASKLTADAQKTPQGQVVDVDFSGAAPVIYAPDANLVWRAKVGEESVNLTNANGKYLSVTNSGLCLSDVIANVYYDNNYGLYGKNGSSSYYIHVSSGKFSVSTTKQKSSRVYLYEMSDFSDKEIIYASRPTSDLEGVGSVTISAPAGTAIFDLQGRRVSNSAHGVYIQGGKKILK